MIRITMERKPCDLQEINRLANVYRIENGYLGYSGTLEEYTKAQRAATNVFELDDLYATRQGVAVNIPNGGFVQVCVDGNPLHVLTSGVLAHSQTLDMLHSIHLRRTVFSAATGGMILVRSRRFASITQPHLLCLEYVIQTSRDLTLVIHSGIDGDVWGQSGEQLEMYNAFSQEGLLSLSAQTRQERVPVAVCENTILPEGTRTFIQEEKRILQAITVQAAAYQPIAITKFEAVYTGIDSLDPLEEGKHLCHWAAQIGYANLYTEHCAMWDQRWRKSSRSAFGPRNYSRSGSLTDLQNLC